MPTNPVLMNRALMLAKIESSYNVDALPTPVSDSFLVSATDVKMTPNVLTRNFYRPSLSPVGIFVGRKLASVTFQHEIKGSGNSAVAPKLGTFLRGCGFAQTSVAANAAGEISDPIVGVGNTGPVVTWTKFAALTKGWTRYKMKVVLGGASATAKVQVFGNPPDWAENTVLPEDDYSVVVMGPGATTTVAVDTTNPLAVTYTVATPQIGDIVVAVVGGLRYKYTIASAVANTEATALAAVMVDGSSRFTAAAVGAVITATITGGVTTVTTGTTAVNLGGSGGQVKLTWTGSLVLNDYWNIDTLRPGYHYHPISTLFESLTIYVYYDGSLHRLTGCIGTVKFTGAAGQYGMAEFTFTGQYNNPDDQPLPLTSVFEATAPTQVELAQLQISNARNVMAQSFNIDMSISVNPRESVSHPDGYNGVLYTARAPKGGANPEMAFESEEPYWRNMAAAKYLRFFSRIGTVANNMVTFSSKTIQLTGNTYTDRNNQRVYDLGFSFAADQFSGDDELDIAFPSA